MYESHHHGCGESKMGTLALVFVFISTQPNLVLLYIKCKGKLELMVIRLRVSCSLSVLVLKGGPLPESYASVSSIFTGAAQMTMVLNTQWMESNIPER